MRSRLILAVAGLSILTALTGCSGSTTDSTGSADRAGAVSADAHVDVDTPALRKQKRAAGIADCPAPPPAAASGGLPDVTLPCLGGGPDVHLPQLRGPMVISLFAQWCGPCRAELPYFQQLHEAAGDRVQVLGVDYLDTQPGAALALAADTGVTFPLLADPSSELRVPFRVRGLPVLVLVNRTGEVVFSQPFSVDSYAQLADLVEKHLGVTVPAAG